MNNRSRVLASIIGLLIGWVGNKVYHHYHDPTPIVHPLKVTIIDSGGAKLKVESRG